MPIQFDCASCGKPFTVEDEKAGRWGKCSACGAVMRIPRHSGRPAPMSALRLLTIIFGSFGLCLALLITWAFVLALRPPGRPTINSAMIPAPVTVDRGLDAPSIGQDGFLGLPGGKGVLMATSDADWDDFIEARTFASAGGDGALGPLQRMLLAGRVRMYPNGTRIRVRKSGFVSRFVEVVEGEYQGHSGWIEIEYVRRTPP